MQMGSVNQKMVVTANAIAVDTNSSQLNTDVQSEQLRELPQEGNRFLVLASLAPGVKPISQGYGVNTNPRYNFLGADAPARPRGPLRLVRAPAFRAHTLDRRHNRPVSALRGGRKFVGRDCR
jgi:hypothetical protein